MCDCFHLAFPNWHAASSGTGGRRLRGPEAATEDDSVSDSTCDEPARFTEGERPRPQGSSPVEEFPETEKYTDSDKECEGEHDPNHKGGSGKKSKKSGLGSMFEKRSTPKMSKLKEVPSPESGVIVKTAKDGCAEGLVYGGGGRDGIFIKGVVPESPASKSLKLKEGDQILSATVYFDNVSYEDAIQILEHAQAYKMKLCLKRKPDLSQTEAPNESDVIPEEDTYAPEMREQGKTKRRGDARISWPKFPSFGKGRKAHFTRSHSSSEADEQRKLELSPTTSDTESPIKSQDALKGKKKNKMKLSVLTKRGRISSSEDQDTVTTGQISSDIQQTQESDMLSPECLESPSGDIPQVYVSKDLKEVGDLRLEQNNQTLTESGTPQHKVELISIDSTLKTTDLTEALANQDSQTGVKSPDGKKKKKEKSELKLKILGKDKSKKAKSSPKRLKTLGASLEVSDQNDMKTTDVPPTTESTQMDLSVPEVELNVPDVDFKQKSPKKGKEKTQKSKQKQEKSGVTIKLPQVGLGDATNEEAVRQVSVNVEEYKPKIELLTATGAEVKDDPYDKLSKERLSRTQLPKREDIEIPGMEDKSTKTKVKGIKESKRQHEETVQMSIDVDSVKEAVSKLPGYKLPKVDTDGMPIPEEITVIDANAQRISVKTPTKVVDTKTRHDTHFIKFDAAASQDSSKTTVKLPKMRAADLTTEELLFETRLDANKPQKQHKTKPQESHKEIQMGSYEREDIVIPGRETTHSFDQTSDGIKGEKTIYLQDIKMSKTEIMTEQGRIGGLVSDVKIPEIDGIEFIDSVEGSPAKTDASIGLSGFNVNLDAKLKADTSLPEITGQVKDVKAEKHISVNVPGGDVTIDGSEIKSPDCEGKGIKFKMPSIGISLPKVKEPKTDLSPSKKDVTVTLPEAKAVVKGPPETDTAIGSVIVSLPGQKTDVNINPPQIEGELDAQGNKFKIPKFGIKMPKLESPKLDINVSKTDADVKLQDAEAKVKLPKAPEVDLTVGSVDVSIPEHKMKEDKTATEGKSLKIEGELDPEGSKFKLPKLGIAMPKVKGPDVDLSSSKKEVEVTLPEAEAKIHVPDTELKAKVEVKAPEIKVAKKDAKGSPLKFKMPSFKLSKSEAAAPNISAEKPDVNTEGADIKISKEGLETNITAPSIDAVGSSIDIKVTGSELEGKGGKFKIPSLGFSKPKMKEPKVDLSKKEVDVALPQIKADVVLPKTEQREKDISLPDVKMKMPDAEVTLPETTKINFEVQAPELEAETDGHEGKFKVPKFEMKLPKIKGPDFDFSLSKGEADVKLPEPHVKLPEGDPGKIDASLSDVTIEVKKPELETQPLDVDGQQGDKFKMPKFDIKMPKIKGPEIDLSLSKQDIEVKSPKIDVTVGKVEVEEQDSKLKMPKFGVSIPKVKAPEIHLGLSKKDVEVTAPEAKADVALKAPTAKIEMTGPKIEVAADDTVKSSSQFTMPDISFSMPKVKGPDIHFRLPKKDADVKLPEVKAEVKLPEAPEIDVKVGSVDVSLPDAKIQLDKPELEIKPLEIEGEIEGNKFKMPKFGIKMPKIEGPKFDVSMSKKDVKLPEAEVKLSEAPEIDVKLGSADVSLPEATMKLEKPELEIKPLKTEAELDGQGTKFKMPKLGVTIPKVKKPDVDFSISKKDVDVTLPEVKGEIKLPDVEVKKPSAEVDIDAPEVKAGTKDTKGSPLKFKMPALKLPKFGVGAPNVSAELPDVDKDIKIEGADIRIPEEVLTVNVEAPNIDAKAPSIDIKSSETKHEGKSGKFKVPSLGFKGPEVDISLQKTDVTLPEVKAEVKLPDVEVKKVSAEAEIKSPEMKITTKDKKGSPSKFKMPFFKMPKFGFGTPSVPVEVLDADIKIPEEILTVNIEAPSIEAKAPTIDITTMEKELEVKGGKLKAPSLSIEGPDVDISKKDVTIPDVKADVEVPGVSVDVKASKAEGQGGKFKMPEFGITAPKIKIPDFNFERKDVTLQGANVEVDLPDLPTGKATVDFEAPNIDLEAQPLDVKMTGIKGEGKESKFKVPKFGISLPKVQGPEIDFNSSKRDVKLPEGKVDINLPKAPEVDVDLGNVDVSIPETKLEIKKPELEIKPLEIEVELEESKFKVPKFGIKMPEIRGPKFDVSLSKKEAKLPEAPEMDAKLGTVDVSLPDAKMKLHKPELEIKPLEIEGEIEGSKFKMPKFGIKMPKIEGPKFDVSMSKQDVKLPEAEVKLPEAPEIDVTFGSVDVSLPEATMKLEKPELEIKPLKTEVELDGQGTKFKMPKLGVTIAKVKGPDVDFNLSRKDTEVTLPEAEVGVTAVEVPSAKVEIKGADTDAQLGSMKGSPSKFKLPTFKFPKFGVATPNVSAELPDVDKDIKLHGADMDITVPEADIKVPEVKAEIGLPDIEVKPGEIAIEPPSVEIDAKQKKPRFSLPRLSFSKPSVKVPEIDVNVAIPEGKMEVKGEKIEVKPPESETGIDGQGSKFKMPKLGITVPKVSGPDIDISLKKKDMDVTLPEVELPDVELKKPSAEVDIKAPSFKLDTDATPSTFKIPTFKLPKFGVSSPNVSAEVPDMDVKIDRTNIEIPEEVLTVNMEAPSIDTKAPTVDIKTKGTELEGKEIKLKMPSFGFKGPEIDISASKDVDVTLPEVKAGVKLPDVEVKKPSAEVEIKGPGIDLKTSDVEGSPSKFKMPTFKIPKFGIASPEVSVDVPDVDRDIKVDGGDLQIKGAKAEMKLPDFEIKEPSGSISVPQAPDVDIDVKSRKTSWTMPRFSFSKPSVKAPEVDVNLPKVEVSLQEGTVEVKQPHIEFKQPEGDVQLDGQKSKFKFPSLGFKGPEIDLSMSKKDVDVKVPELKAEVKLPDVDIKKPSAEVEIKSPEIKLVTKDTEGSPSKFKMPTFKMPKFGGGSPSVSVDVPDMDKDIKLEGADIKIPEEVLTMEVVAPSIEIKGPSVDIKTKEAEKERRGSKFKFPSLGFKAPEIDLNVPKKDIEVTVPEVKAEVKLPDVEVKKPSAEVEIKSPEIKIATKDTDGSPSKFKMPTFKIPKFGVGSPSASVDVPDMDKDLKIEGAEIKIPEEVLAVNIEAKGPEIDIKTKGLEHEERGSKFKFPSLGFKGPDVDISKKDAEVKLPEVKAEVQLPDVKVKKPSAEVEIKSPGIDLKSSDVEGSPSKIKMPTFKFPKFGVGGPHVSVEGPDLDKDMNLEGADLKIEGPKVEVKLPDVKVKKPSGSISVPEAPDVDIDVKSRKTSWTMPRFSFSKPSVKAPEAEINLEAPKVEVSIPEGTVEVKQPEGDVQLDGQKSKFKFPSLGFKGPEIDLSMSKTDVDVKLPEVKAEVKLPDVDVKKPSAEVEIKSPDIKIATKDTDGSPSKFKMPTFKMPKFGGGSPSVSVDVPDMDKDVKLEGADIKIPEEVLTVEVGAPSIETKGASVDIKMTESEHERRGSKFKLPSFGFKRPEIDLSVSKKDGDVKLPDVEAEVKIPDVDVKKPSAEVEIKSPEIKMAKKDTDGSPSKFKMPTFKMPKFGGGSPSVSVDVPDMDKDVKLEGADIKIPEEVLTVEVGAPSIKTKGASVDIKMTESEHERRGSKFKFPSLGFKGPDVDISKKDAEVKLPEVKAEVQLPDVKVKKPSAEVEIKSPGIDLKASDVEGSPSKIKMPTFKFPKFGVGGPHVSVEGPDLDKDMNLEGADLKIEGPKVEVKLPDVKVKEPSGSISVPEAPDVDIDGKSRKTSWTMPRFSFSKPSVKAPEAEINLEAPKVEVSIPEGTVEVKQPEGDVQLDGQKSKFKFPSLGFKGPEIDLSMSKKDIDVKLPEVKAEIKLPDVEGKEPSGSISVPEAPDVDIDVKSRKTSWTMPRFSFSKPSVKAPEAEINLEAPKVEVSIPEGTVEVKQPEGDVQLDGQKSKFKFPSFGFKGPEIDLSVSKKDVDVKLPEVKAEVKLPDIDVKKPSAEVEMKSPEIKIATKDTDGSPSKFKMPTFKMPKFGGGSPSVSVDVPDMDKDVKLEGADIKIPEEVLTVEVGAPSIKTKGASVDIKMTESEHERRGSKFKFPSFGFKGPEIDSSVSKKDGDVTLPEVKAEVKLPDVDVKKHSVDVEIKSPEIKLETKDADGSPSKFKMPTFKMPKFGGGTTNVTAEIPDIDTGVKTEGVDIKVSEEVLAVNIKAPQIETKDPSIHIKSKGAEHEGKGSKIKLPSLGFKGPDVDISKKEVDVTLPEVKAEVQLPDVKIQKPSAKVKVKAPGFKPQASDKPEDVSVDVKAQEGEAEGSGSKFKLPSFGISTPKVKGPEIDVSLSKKDVTLPEVSAEVQLPDIKIKEVEGADSEAKAKRPSWAFPRFSFSKSSGKVPDSDLNLETPKVDVEPAEAKAEVCLPDVEVKQSGMKLEVKPPEMKIKSPEIGIAKPKVSQKDVNITLPEVRAEVKFSEGEVQDTDAKSKEALGSPLKFKMPTMKMPKFGGATHDTQAMETPSAEKTAQIEDIKPDVNVTFKGPSIDIKAAASGSETQKDETDGMGLESPSKFKLPSFKMPRLSFSRTKSEEENVPVDAEHGEDEVEFKPERQQESKSPKLSSLGNILKTVDVEFDVPNAEKAGDNLETSKEAKQYDESPGKRVDKEVTKSPERTGWFNFRFGLSSPSEAPKTLEKDLKKNERSPAGETGDEDASPSCSVQSSDAFADISSTVTSELVGPSVSSPTKVTVKYSDPGVGVGPGELQSNIITSMARTELISDIPDVPEKITILSSGFSSSSEDTLRLESGKIHLITSNIQATPESQHARLLTAIQVQPAASISLTSEAKEASSWTMEDTQGGVKTVFERRFVRETSSERSESTETTVITKQISHVFESSEPISGETASSIQRLRDTVHSEKMKFFDEAEK